MQWLPSRSTIPVIWELEGEIFPEQRIPLMNGDGTTYAPNNAIIYCDHCGQVWGRKTVLLDRERNYLFRGKKRDQWWTHKALCRDCGFGSLWKWYSECWNRGLTRDLLIREIFIHADYIERGINPRTDT